MSREHSHSHVHSHEHAQRTIGLAFALNLAFGLTELGGGWWVGSVAVLAGAMHDLGDALSLALAWGFERFAERTPDRRFNFGYRRFSLLSAVITGAIVITGAVAIAIEAAERLRAPASEALGGWGMVAFAAAGLAVNGFAALRLSLGRTHNERMLTWHMLEDCVGWTAILVGAFAIRLTGYSWIDAALALALSTFVAVNVVRRLISTVFLFLQGRPENFDEDSFVADVLKIDGVAAVDHVRVWSLDGDAFALTLRLRLGVATLAEAEVAKGRARALALHLGAVADCIAIETAPAG